jgi:hypothetical protein
MLWRCQPYRGVNEGLVLKIGGWKTRKMLDRYNVTNRKRLVAALRQSGEYVAERMNGRSDRDTLEQVAR